MHTSQEWKATCFILESSPNSNSTCRMCNKGIHQNILRLGTMFTHDDGHILLEWRHLKCTSIVPPKFRLSLKERNQFSADHLAEIDLWLASRATSKPVGLDARRPKFIKAQQQQCTSAIVSAS